MIFTEVNFFAETLGRRSSMNVLLPQPSYRSNIRPRYRTLYLLHGRSDDHTAWLRWTSIERYAEGLNLAVIMPNVHLSFYTNMVHGGRYWDFVSEEVPAIAHSMFPLSTNRADTFVAGLSMGGYGAFKFALTHPERFAAAASLSGALDIRRYVRNEDNLDRDNAWRSEMHDIFGDLQNVAGSQNDLMALARSASQCDPKPRLFQCCGTEDFLYQNNLAFRDFLRALPLDLTYIEEPGEHNWAFWDKMTQKMLAWMFTSI